MEMYTSNYSIICMPSKNIALRKTITGVRVYCINQLQPFYAVTHKYNIPSHATSFHNGGPQSLGPTIYFVKQTLTVENKSYHSNVRHYFPMPGFNSQKSIHGV